MEYNDLEDHWLAEILVNRAEIHEGQPIQLEEWITFIIILDSLANYADR
jgi:hypothetical protein